MKFLLLIFLLIFANCGEMFCQTNLTIKLHKGLDPSKMMIYYSDGETFKYSTRDFVNNEIIIKEPLHSRYAVLSIFYPNKVGHLQGASFYIDGKQSFLEINPVNDDVIDKVSNYKIRNLIDRRKTKVYARLNKYTAKEMMAYKIASNAYNSDPTVANEKLLTESLQTLYLKELQFIKQNGKNYFHFAKFTQDIVRPLMTNHLLELYEVFNTAFPEEFKNSYEGKSVKTLLEGNLYVKIGMQSPAFKISDYTGKEISTDGLKGKYYLLSFWATWCSPCIKEIPQLKRIRDAYKEDELTMISISCDTDSAKFINGIDQYKMNWTHLFNTPMRTLFGDKPIPSVYLIDKNGKILFSSWELALPELEAILKKEVGHD